MLISSVFRFSTLLILVALINHSLGDEEQKSVSPKDRFRLHSGDLMPYVGFGTYLVTGDEHILNLLDKVLGAGYRLIDSAQYYSNEESIGKALKVLLPKYNLTRKDIFITTKLDPAHLGDKVYERVKESVKKLDTEYVDLFLIHFPTLFMRNISSTTKNNSVLRDETWQVLVQAKKDGLVKNIGVSNYRPKHLNEVLKNDHGVKPAVNQVEWHPGFHQTDLLELCEKEGILLQAYFSLGGTRKKDFLITKPEVVAIAKKLNKSPSQVLLRWALQQKVAIIPKASSEAHIKENIDLDFTIPEEDMKVLSGFEQKPLGIDSSQFD